VRSESYCPAVVEESQAATETRVGARWAAGALLVAAVVAGVLGHMVLPQMLVWLLIGILVWAAVTIFWRTIDHQFRTLPPNDNPGPLQPGESFDDAVKLTWVPNVPVAEAICTRLLDDGIEAFYKRIPTFDALSTVTSDFDPAEIWVAEHDLERARTLLPPQ
jgi:hypothetical protein